MGLKELQLKISENPRCWLVDAILKFRCGCCCLVAQSQIFPKVSKIDHFHNFECTNQDSKKYQVPPDFNLNSGF
jgi:hypothetical protein